MVGWVGALGGWTLQVAEVKLRRWTRVMVVNGMRELNTEPGVSMPRAEAIMLAAVLGLTEEKQDHKRRSREREP